MFTNRSNNIYIVIEKLIKIEKCQYIFGSVINLIIFGSHFKFRTN